MTNRKLAAAAMAVALWGMGDLIQGVAFAQVDEIIVTVRKREESLQDVPLSVNAFTAEKIRQLGVNNLSQISDFTPNFSFEKFGARRGAQDDVSRPVIRGQANILGEPNAQFFIDGVPFSESILSFPFVAVERIEVIRGPQAALFGRSTFSGAVNLITKRGTNEFENQASGRIGSHEDYEINLSSRGPIVDDKLFYFISGRYYDYGGEYINEIDGRKVGQEQSWGSSGSLELRATDNLTFIARGGYYEDDDGHAPERVQDRSFNNCFFNAVDIPLYYCGEVTKFESVRVLSREDMGFNQGLRREVVYGSFTAEWDIAGSGWLLTSNTGASNADSKFGYDATRLGDPLNQTISGIPGERRRREIIDREEWSTELRLASPEDNPLRGLIGGYFYNRDKDEITRHPLTGDLQRDFGSDEAQNIAVFGALEFDIIDPLTLRGEVRWQKDEITLHQATGVTLSARYYKVLPRVTLSWDVTDDVMIYALAAKGNKPGGFNTNPSVVLDPFRSFDEEKAWNYEAGMKSDLFDGRLRLNLSGFHIDWTNQQLTNSLLAISFITNAGQTKVWGAEIEADASITDELNLGLTYGYARSQLKEFCDLTSAATNFPVSFGPLVGFFPECITVTGATGGQVAGNRVPNSPRHQFSSYAQYVYPLGNTDIDLFLRGDYSYRSKIYSQVHNFAYVGGRNLLNLKAGFTKGDLLKMTFYVDNVLDDLTPSTVVRFLDLSMLPTSRRGFLVPLARGRHFGVTMDLNF